MSDVTRILLQLESGDSNAADHLLPLVYDELRRLAAAKLANEKPDGTLQATALVHEAYLRLVDADRIRRWDSRGHFFGAAAEAMRRILVESARRKQRLRHGGGRRRLKLSAPTLADQPASEDILALDEALERLSSERPLVAQVVKLRYFAGLTVDQVAAALDISQRTVHRHWAYARAWLYQQLSCDSASG